MTSFLNVRWEEWFSIAMLIFTVGFPVFFLIMSFRRHHLDNPDCTKFNLFRLDPGYNAKEQPPMPSSCDVQYLQKRSWLTSVNTAWVWVTLGIGGIWVAIMLIAFIASRGIVELRQALPL